MSKSLINQYYTNLDRAVQFGKSKNEQSIRNHFWNLLNDYARKQNYEVVTEVTCMGTKGNKVRPDGIVKNPAGRDLQSRPKSMRISNLQTRWFGLQIQTSRSITQPLAHKWLPLQNNRAGRANLIF